MILYFILGVTFVVWGNELMGQFKDECRDTNEEDYYDCDGGGYGAQLCNEFNCEQCAYRVKYCIIEPCYGCANYNGTDTLPILLIVIGSIFFFCVLCTWFIHLCARPVQNQEHNSLLVHNHGMGECKPCCV